MERMWIVLLIICTGIACQRMPATNIQDNKKDKSVTVAFETFSPSETEVKESSKKGKSSFAPFYIYHDKVSTLNHYIPSGFMPDGKCVMINDNFMENCQTGKSCMKVIFDVPCAQENQKWAGVYWQYPANNWGQRKGGFNLSGAEKLTFWARGEKGGEQIQEFLVGGIMGIYPDSDMAVIGPVILTPEWKEYTIDLRGKDLSYINGGFAWTTNVDSNPESCIFYLDNIKFE